MESLENQESAYTEEWFKKRAVESLKKIDEGVWDYSDSLLLYVPGSDDHYEAVQETDTPYHRLVTTPERAYLAGIASEVVSALPDDFEYIDLGPGTEHKEQFVFDGAKSQSKSFVYRPVDISDKYLKLSTEYATQQGLTTEPIKSSFEELSGKLGAESRSRFVSLGLTYGNYHPPDILPLLKELIGTKGNAFINAQLRERVDMEAIREMYVGVAESMAAEKIILLGLNPDTDIAEREVTDEIKVWYTLKHSTSRLEAKGIKAGDKLLVFQSIRPTKESLERGVREVFPHYQLLDTGGPFVGVLLKASE